MLAILQKQETYRHRKIHFKNKFLVLFGFINQKYISLQQRLLQ